MDSPESNPTQTEDALDPRTLELLHKARAGDRSCVRVLYHRYGPQLRDRIRRMMGAKAREMVESVDLLQELFLEVLRDLERFEIRSESAFLRWATVIARNNIRDRLRRRRESFIDEAEQVAADPQWQETFEEPSPSQKVSASEEVDGVRRAIARLPEEYQRVIELRDFRGLPYRQIATQLGRETENAVQMLHHRALARLTRELKTLPRV